MTAPLNRWLVWTPWSKLPSTSQWFTSREDAIKAAERMSSANIGLTFYVMQITDGIVGGVVETY